MRRSVLASVIATLDRKLRKNGHSAYIASNTSPCPSARAAANPVRTVRGGGDHVHGGVPAGQRLRALPGGAVEGGGLQGGRQGQLQVLPGQSGQRVLVGDD